MSRENIKLLLVAVFCIAVGLAGPAAAHGVNHALFAHNADKVDGKHAVGAGASRAERAGRLVATDAGGMLPGNIIPKQARLVHVTAADGATPTLFTLDGLTVKLMCTAKGNGDPETTEVMASLGFSGAQARMDGIGVFGPFSGQMQTSQVDRPIPATGDNYGGIATHAGRQSYTLDVFLTTPNSVSHLKVLTVIDVDRLSSGNDPCLAWASIT